MLVAVVRVVRVVWVVRVIWLVRVVRQIFDWFSSKVMVIWVVRGHTNSAHAVFGPFLTPSPPLSAMCLHLCDPPISTYAIP